MNPSGTYISFIFLLLACLGGCQQIGEPWTNVVNSDIYKNQNACVKSCLLDVINHVPPCIDYGCICVGDSRGTNFITASTEVSSCAQKCGTTSDATSAANALRDICLLAVGSTSSATSSSSSSSSSSTLSTLTFGNSTTTASLTTSTIRTSSTSTETSSASQSSSTSKPAQRPSLFLINDTTFYPKLTPCSKMAINACRNTTGDIEELPCRPVQNYQDWDTYLGLADRLQATNAFQICDSVAFLLTCSTLANISLHFCNYLPTLQDRPDPEYDSMQGFLADWCVEKNFTRPAGCILVASGDRNSSVVKTPVLSTADKIAIGLGLPATLAALAGAGFGYIGALAAWQTLRWA